MSTSEFNREQLLEIRSYIEEAQDKLRSCYNCQMIDPEGEIKWVGGVHSDVEDLIGNDLEAPEEYWEEIASYLDCPLCGTDLDLKSDVGVISLEEEKIAAMWDDWREEYSTPLSEFYDFLEKYPYLGLEHPVGAEIHKTIAAFPYSDIKNRAGYRARSRDSVIRTSKDMYPPDPALIKIQEGRFNHFGQRMFYIANSEAGAANEALDKEGEVWLQKFKIKQATKIMDLTLNPEDDPRARKNLLMFGLVYGRNLSGRVGREKGWRPEYFVPRFIADCARKAGFNGIKYRSSRHWSENLVLFSWDDDSIEPLGKPYIYTLKADDIIDEDEIAKTSAPIKTHLDRFDEKYKDILHPFVGPFLPGMES